MKLIDNFVENCTCKHIEDARKYMKSNNVMLISEDPPPPLMWACRVCRVQAPTTAELVYSNNRFRPRKMKS